MGRKILLEPYKVKRKGRLKGSTIKLLKLKGNRVLLIRRDLLLYKYEAFKLLSSTVPIRIELRLRKKATLTTLALSTIKIK
jgi:hypothetical protein